MEVFAASIVTFLKKLYQFVANAQHLGGNVAVAESNRHPAKLLAQPLRTSLAAQFQRQVIRLTNWTAYNFVSRIQQRRPLRRINLLAERVRHGDDPGNKYQVTGNRMRLERNGNFRQDT
jgi:hypothetical protein